MSARPRDTTEEAWTIVQDGLRGMSPRERVARAVSLTIAAHGFALAQIRRQYPGEDERRHRLRLAARMLPPELMKRAYGFPGDGS